ncbi:MAG: Gfo/Idh/MocA family oxidoreductase [Armatimonadetes bacterium]|nr:Gfo/Idh/MocA family oxidoreductase [Armatimonadota bacterium]
MEKLKVGILGLGRGLTHLRNFLALDEAEVIGAADRLPAWRQRAEELIGRVAQQSGKTYSCKLVPEFEDLLAMKPDAIAVATNGRMQVQHACQAMDAGCHVTSEVPGAFTERELILLRDTVVRTGKTYMLAENTCFWDFFRYWRKWLLEGRFGQISIANGEYLHFIPNTLDLPQGGRVTPSQAKAQGLTGLKPCWRADQPPIQYLTHDLGPLLEVLDDRCVSVTCRSAPWRQTETPLRSDGQIALFETAKGNLIEIMVTLSTRRPSEHRYRLFGTEGSVEWSLYEGFGRRFERGRTERDGWERVEIGMAARGDDTSTGHGGADLKTARAFARAILGGKPSPIDAFRAIEYCLPGILANRSAELGGVPISIPDLRLEPFAGTRFWDVVGLPEVEPPTEKYALPPLRLE